MVDCDGHNYHQISLGNIELDFTKHSRLRSNHTSTKWTDSSNSPSLTNTCMLPKNIPWIYL